jgi:hypothetical protein
VSVNKKSPQKWVKAFAISAGMTALSLTAISGGLRAYFHFAAADGKTTITKACAYEQDGDGQTASVSQINIINSGVPFYIQHVYSSSTYDFATNKIRNLSMAYSLDVFMPSVSTIRNELFSPPSAMNASEVVDKLGCPLLSPPQV